MNRIKIIWFAAVIPVLSVFITSCEKADEEKPQIEYVHNTGVSDHELYADAGSELSVDISVVDNKSLKQIKVEIYKATSAHSHSSDPVAFKLPQLGLWDTIYVKNISGSEFSGTFVFNVPDTVSGSWNVEVTALDEDGNVTTSNYELMIHNPHIPLILVQSTNPGVSSNGTIQIIRNNTLELTGNVVDLDTLDYVRISLLRNSDTTWTSFNQPINNWTFDLSQITISPIEATGNYRCIIEATDLDGRYNYATATIVVVP